MYLFPIFQYKDERCILLKETALQISLLASFIIMTINKDKILNKIIVYEKYAIYLI